MADHPAAPPEQGPFVRTSRPYPVRIDAISPLVIHVLNIQHDTVSGNVHGLRITLGFGHVLTREEAQNHDNDARNDHELEALLLNRLHVGNVLGCEAGVRSHGGRILSHRIRRHQIRPIPRNGTRARRYFLIGTILVVSHVILHSLSVPQTTGPQAHTAPQYPPAVPTSTRPQSRPVPARSPDQMGQSCVPRKTFGEKTPSRREEVQLWRETA